MKIVLYILTLQTSFSCLSSFFRQFISNVKFCKTFFIYSQHVNTHIYIRIMDFLHVNRSNYLLLTFNISITDNVINP